jgi:hypothetical protein
MKRLTRFTAGALVFGFIAGAGSARADQGTSVIESTKSDGSIITMGGKAYRVSRSTVLEDKDGNKIAFGALPATEQGASRDDAAVWFEASESEAPNPMLHILKLTGAMPR